MTRFHNGRARFTLGAMVLFTTCLASPALADHSAPTGIGGAGATLNLLSPDTIRQGQASVGSRVTLARPDRRSDAELRALAAHHVHAHDADHRLGLALGAALGVTDRLTLSVELPYVRHDDLCAGEHSHVGGAAINEVVSLGSVSGIADPSLIAKFKLRDTGGTRVALVGGLKFPLGDTHRRNNQGHRLETEHQPGTGSWDPLLGAALGTRLGPVNVIASGLYQFAGKGAQEMRLGDRAKGGIAVSRLFARANKSAETGDQHHRGDDHHSEGQEAGGSHHHAHGDHHAELLDPAARPGSSWEGFVELTGEWEGRQSVGGKTDRNSGGTTVWLSPGARFNAANGYSVAAGIGLAVWQDVRPSHPNDNYRLTLSLGAGLLTESRGVPAPRIARG